MAIIVQCINMVRDQKMTWGRLVITVLTFNLNKSIRHNTIIRKTLSYNSHKSQTVWVHQENFWRLKTCSLDLPLTLSYCLLLYLRLNGKDWRNLSGGRTFFPNKTLIRYSGCRWDYRNLPFAFHSGSWECIPTLVGRFLRGLIPRANFRKVTSLPARGWLSTCSIDRQHAPLQILRFGNGVEGDLQSNTT